MQGAFAIVTFFFFLVVAQTTEASFASRWAVFMRAANERPLPPLATPTSLISVPAADRFVAPTSTVTPIVNESWIRYECARTILPRGPRIMTTNLWADLLDCEQRLKDRMQSLEPVVVADRAFTATP